MLIILLFMHVLINYFTRNIPCSRL